MPSLTDMQILLCEIHSLAPEQARKAIDLIKMLKAGRHIISPAPSVEDDFVRTERTVVFYTRAPKEAITGSTSVQRPVNEKTEVGTDAYPFTPDPPFEIEKRRTDEIAPRIFGGDTE